MTRYSVPFLLAAALSFHSVFAQNQYLPLAPLPTTGPNQTIWTPNETFPSFNATSPTFQSFNTTTTGAYNPVPSAGTVLQQVYPTTPLVSPSNLPGALPSQTGTPPLSPEGGVMPLRIRDVPLQNVEPPDVVAAGLATIRNGKWVISDFFYNLSEFIGVRVEILKPQDKDLYLNGALIERQIKTILEGVNIVTEPTPVPCGPPLPVFHVLIMAYPCNNCCIGFITTQLVEKGRPQRLQLDVNGVWQIVTWQRQSLVASNCEDFAHQISKTVKDLATEFANRYAFYHPRPEIPCFNVSENSRLPPPTNRDCP